MINALHKPSFPRANTIYFVIITPAHHISTHSRKNTIHTVLTRTYTSSHIPYTHTHTHTHTSISTHKHKHTQDNYTHIRDKHKYTLTKTRALAYPLFHVWEWHAHVSEVRIACDRDLRGVWQREACLRVAETAKRICHGVVYAVSNCVRGHSYKACALLGTLPHIYSIKCIYSYCWPIMIWLNAYTYTHTLCPYWFDWCMYSYFGSTDQGPLTPSHMVEKAFDG